MKAGAVFRDNLCVDEFLGAGLHGEVYKVTHVHTGISFALKVMHLEDRDQASKVRRALSTAKGSYRVQHANVVQVHDLGCEPDGMVWVLMELLEGRSLASLLAPRTSLGVLFAYAVAIEVAWGLAAAHEAQVIHRDIKPDNVFLTAEGVVKVLDFSIAKCLPDGVRTTQRQTGMGTPAYMSPENIAGEEPDVRFDVYSLGLVLWEMIVGRHPFEDALRSTSEMFRRQHSVHPVPLSLAARLPDYVDGVIEKATAKDPAERFASIAEMARALIDVRARLVADVDAHRLSLPPAIGLPLAVRDPQGRAEYHTDRAPDLDPPPPLPSQRVVLRSAPQEERPDRTLPLPPAIGPAGTLPLGAYLARRHPSAATVADAGSDAGPPDARVLPAAELEDPRDTPHGLAQLIDDANAPTQVLMPTRSRFATVVPVLGVLLVAMAVLGVALGRASRGPHGPAAPPVAPTETERAAIPPPSTTALAPPAIPPAAETASSPPAPPPTALASTSGSARTPPLPRPTSGGSKPVRPVPPAPTFKPLFGQ